MFDQSPSQWLGAGYSVASNEVRLKTSSALTDVTLPEVTDAQADPTTGDVRFVVFALVDAIANTYVSKPQAERPVNMQINKSVRALSDGQLQYSYSISFNVTAEVDVAPEPVPAP